MGRAERLELGRPKQGVLRPFLPAVVRVAGKGLTQEAECAGVPVILIDGELAVPDAIEKIADLPVVPGLRQELLRVA